jgi:phytoene synthase
LSVEACAEIVRRGDPDRFLAVMAAPLALRGPLFVLYAFNLEVARAPWVTREPMIAEMRLQFWADVLDEAAGDATPRAHEVAGPLAELIRARDVPVQLLTGLVAARRFDIGTDGHASREAFDRYLDQTSGNLVAAALCIAGVRDPSVAADAGWAFGLAALFRAVPALQAAGRRPLVSGAPDDVAALAHEGLAKLAHARRRAPRDAAPVLRAGWLAGPVLARAARDPAAVTEGRLLVSEARRRGTLLLKTVLGRW